MTTEKMDYEQTQPQTLIAAIEKFGLKVRARFIPCSESNNAALKYPTLNWHVTIYDHSPLDGQRRDIVAFNYDEGRGNCPAHKIAPMHEKDSERRDILIAWECEHGVRANYEHDSVWLRPACPEQRIEPDAVQIIHGVIEDVRTALVFDRFEDWAEAYGHDTDSRAAEAIYNAARSRGLKFKSGLHRSVINELVEASEGF